MLVGGSTTKNNFIYIACINETIIGWIFTGANCYRKYIPEGKGEYSVYIEQGLRVVKKPGLAYN
jgi:hypothetical protein